MNIDAREWLETDGLGGFASGTACLVRTRRYHGLLAVATAPPSGRVMLVNGFDAWLETDAGTINLTTHRYAPDVLHPDGVWRLDQFQPDPWPTWRWRVHEDVDLLHDVLMPRGTPRVLLRWRLAGRLSKAILRVRPFFSGRDYHALHHENTTFAFDVRQPREDTLEWHPYAGVPGVRCRTNATYTHAPDWFHNFLYLEDRNRGYDDTEDLASPGVFEWNLGSAEAVWMIEPDTVADTTEPALEMAWRHRQAEHERRRVYPSRVHRSASHFEVRRGEGCTIIAGYPWYGERGRDTFVALRGLCLSSGRVTTARRVLLQWADVLSDGMLPNRFGDRTDVPEYDSVDASLWFVIAVHDLVSMADGHRGLTDGQRRRLLSAVDEILRAYCRGTRHGIHVDSDGLLAAGGPGLGLTWMDARAGDHFVTPRVGKPVEVQALWLNALAFAGRESPEWRRWFDRGLPAFRAKFWNTERGCLYDVVDVDHVPGRTDGTLRPNQVFAVGGLPLALLTGPRARQIVDVLEQSLLTPLGLRTLAPGDPNYAARYDGHVEERAYARHNGTVFPWLMGPFVDAWVRVRDGSRAARIEARHRFVRPLFAELDKCGFGHLPEMVDAEAPFTPRGCPFAAASLGELVRLTTDQSQVSRTSDV